MAGRGLRTWQRPRRVTAGTWHSEAVAVCRRRGPIRAPPSTESGESRELLGPACADTVTAAEELRAVLVDLEQLPMRPVPGSATGVETLKQDGTPQRMIGVDEAAEHVRAVLAMLGGE